MKDGKLEEPAHEFKRQKYTTNPRVGLVVVRPRSFYIPNTELFLLNHTALLRHWPFRSTVVFEAWDNYFFIWCVCVLLETNLMTQAIALAWGHVTIRHMSLLQDTKFNLHNLVFNNG